jgi:hypothetical protein
LASGDGMLGPHLGPVGVELFGDERGEAGERALAELDMLDQHRHRVIGGDPDEGVRREAGTDAGLEYLRCARLRPAGLRQAEPDHERAGALQEVAAGEGDVMRGHGQPSSVRAASWIAARMRT